METTNPLVSSESVLMQVMHSDSANSSQCVEPIPQDNDKTPPAVDQQNMSQSANFTHMMWGRLRPGDANVPADNVSYAMGSVWNMLTNEERELFQNDKVPSEEALERYSKQILSLVNEHHAHQGSLNEPSSGNVDTSSLGNILQSDSSAWQEVADNNSLEPGECTSKMDVSEGPQSILNLEHIEGQVLLGIGLPEWGEVLQKDDEGRLLDMNFMSSDAEKRMLRATIIERSKEINRLQRELNAVFQIIHQLKQENEYLTQQQQFSQLQQSQQPQTPQQSNVHLTPKTQSVSDALQSGVQHDKQGDLASQMTSNDQQQEFLSMQSSQQNDQLLLLELLNHIPPPSETQ